MATSLPPLPLPSSVVLETLCNAGFLRKSKLGRTNFYINEPLFKLLST